MTDRGLDDVRDLDRRALAATAEVVAAVAAADLERPTPCKAWPLAGLLRHLVCQNRGYGASSLGAPAILSIWDNADLRPDPHRAYQDSAAVVTAAFAEPNLRDGMFEVREFGYYPAPVAIGMHFVDVLVHGWDVAVSIGVPYRPDDELATRALAIAAGWPGTGWRRQVFGRRVPVPADASDLTRLLGLLGRSPAWKPPWKPS
jgi:uncharacterized protein (TIGR03086 family)